MVSQKTTPKTQDHRPVTLQDLHDALRPIHIDVQSLRKDLTFLRKKVVEHDQRFDALEHCFNHEFREGIQKILTLQDKLATDIKRRDRDDTLFAYKTERHQEALINHDKRLKTLEARS